MWKDMYKSFVQTAGDVNYNKMTKTELADGYCDADEEGDIETRDKYYAALMVKYWYMVTYNFNASRSLGVEYEDVVFWISEAIDKGLKYRRWRDPKNKLSKDINGAEKVFNRAFWSVRNAHYIHANRQKRNPEEMILSYDDLKESIGENNWAIVEKSVGPDYFNRAQEVVQELLSRGKLLDALVVDGIAYQDTFTSTTGRKINGEKEIFNNIFSKQKLATHLKNIDSNFLKYFQDTYGYIEKDILKELTVITKKNRNEVEKQVSKILKSLKESEVVYNILVGQ